MSQGLALCTLSSGEGGGAEEGLASHLGRTFQPSSQSTPDSASCVTRVGYSDVGFAECGVGGETGSREEGHKGLEHPDVFWNFQGLDLSGGIV